MLASPRLWRWVRLSSRGSGCGRHASSSLGRGRGTRSATIVGEEVPVPVTAGSDHGDVSLSREVTDRLLAADSDLRQIDGERFHLDLSEIIDEASKIASLP